MPASTSSKTRVDTLSFSFNVALIANITLESSPPLAISFMLLASIPGLALIKKSTASQPSRLNFLSLISI